MILKAEHVNIQSSYILFCKKPVKKLAGFVYIYDYEKKSETFIISSNYF